MQSPYRHEKCDGVGGRRRRQVPASLALPETTLQPWITVVGRTHLGLLPVPRAGVSQSARGDPTSTWDRFLRLRNQEKRERSLPIPSDSHRSHSAFDGGLLCQTIKPLRRFLRCVT